VRDVAAELLAEHDRHRRAALEAHGIRVTALRRAGTAAETKTLRLIQARLDEHDEQTCRHVLEVLAADWLRDDSQFKPRDWTCEDAIWSTNFDRHRVRDVGSTFGGKRAPRDNGLSNLATADDFAAMQAELDARNHRA
jgi:hypothetical protein